MDRPTNEMILKLVDVCDDTVCVGQTSSFKVVVVHESCIVQDHEEIAFEVQIFIHSQDDAQGLRVSEDHYHISSTCKISKGVCDISLIFLEPIPEQSRAMISIMPSSQIPSITSRPKRIVSNKLVISSTFNHPIKWYKDEGGRESCIQLPVYVTGQALCTPVKLVARLHYQDKSVVEDQSILEVLNKDKLILKKVDVPLMVSVRITEVSMNHQGKQFSVLIEPEISENPEWSSIQPVYSPPIHVLSKRSRKRKPFSASLDTSTLSCPPNTPTNALAKYSALLYECLQQCEWVLIGFQQDIIPIYQCPACKSHSNSMKPTHSQTCPFAQLFATFSTLSPLQQLPHPQHLLNQPLSLLKLRSFSFRTASDETESLPQTRARWH